MVDKDQDLSAGSHSNFITLAAGTALLLFFWKGSRKRNVDRSENQSVSSSKQLSYTIARIASRIIFWLSPRGFTLTGDEGWTGVTRAATGAEKFAPTIIYPNSWSSSHRKKVVYLQRSPFFTDSPKSGGVQILLMAMVFLVIGNSIFLPGE